MTQDTARRYALYGIFVVSGFTSLIYESIWSHYLKLFLGHAAYSQTLVLAIFMGGMAVGSWWIGRNSVKLPRLLVGYAVVEGIIGVCGLIFHPLFVKATGWTFESVLPSFTSPFAIHAFKWALGTLLILPQSILLGMTFPMISNGILRRWPGEPGATLSLLYFTNSIGAALGVLVSGFVLIEAVGLPGTILTAGILNILLAVTAWMLTRDGEGAAPPAPSSASESNSSNAPGWFVCAAFVTGVASFFYEMGWIRMLSLVLGSSTHSFELMLSAFIFGLACGGLWMRRRIDRIQDAAGYLGFVMIAMGAFALLTLPTFNWTFDVIARALRTLARTDTGFTAFNVVSHLVATAVMLPATFCAGMTLPLLTRALLRSGGEQAIGTVYAANTFGAIVGVLLTTHFVMPVFGVKGVITGGAIMHMALGVSGLMLVSRVAPARRMVAAAAAVVLVLGTTLFAHVDPLRMLSGVYRSGRARLPADTHVMYLRDGKTATISVIERAGVRFIATNGKTDASIQMDHGRPHDDEITMIVAAAIPLSLHPHPDRVANIGFGSGLTSATLLASDRIKRLDSIEIEPFMVEGAKLAFGQRIQRVFDDPRSHVRFEDAKTFFATVHEPYDVIVSEPSNPWVSGVATLFSDEFYKQMTRHLAPDGYFVQWIQIYETDISIVASITKALSRHFAHYRFYVTDDSDVLIIATQAGSLPDENATVFDSPALRGELNRIGIDNVTDLRERRIGDTHSLGRLLLAHPAPANSDFFPFVDLNAARLRYMEASALELTDLRTLPLPVTGLIDSRQTANTPVAPSGKGLTARDESIRKARVIRDGVMAGTPDQLPPAAARDVLLIETPAERCKSPIARDVWRRTLRAVANETSPYLTPEESRPLWEKIRSTPCYLAADGAERAWADFLSAVALRDTATIVRLGTALYGAAPDRMTSEELTYLVTATAAAQIAQNDPAAATETLRQTWKSLDHRGVFKTSLLTMLAMSEAEKRTLSAAGTPPAHGGP